jgi:hypothetical protein
MRFSVGSKLSIVLVNGKSFTGVLIEPYTKDQCVLQLENGFIRVIQNTFYNILLVDVFKNEVEKSKAEVAITEPLELPGIVDDEKDRFESLAELYLQRSKLEKENAKKLLTSKEIVGGKDVNYAWPVFGKGSKIVSESTSNPLKKNRKSFVK